MLIDLIQNRKFSYSTYICQQYLNPNYTKIACLDATIYNMQIKRNITSPSEFTFDVSYVYNDAYNTYNSNIDILVSGAIILLESKIDDVVTTSDYFYLSEVTTNSEGGINSKSCKCFSLEYKFNFLKMPPMDFPTYLYQAGTNWNNSTPTSSGILNYIIQVKLLNTWSIGTISASLLNWKQIISFSRNSVLSVFRQLEEQFNCVFEFVSSTRTINVYSYDDLPDETGLILSDTNYINSIRNTNKMDEVVSRLIVYGKNSETIRGINVSKEDYIDNFDYFMPYMSSSLQSALSAYKIKLAGLEVTNTNLLASLQSAQDTYLDLHYNPTTGLYTLQTSSAILQNSMDSATKLNDSASYTTYYNQKVAIDAQIASKVQAISTQQGVIDGIKAQRDALAVEASYDNLSNFTSAQKLELLSFIHEDTVNASTSEVDNIMRFGRDVLTYKSQPPIEYDVDIVDLLSALDEGYAIDKIVLGAKINIIDSELNISTSARITSIDHNYENSSLKLTISNKNMLNDPMTYMMNILAKTTNENKNLLSERDFYKNYTSTYPLDDVQADTTSGSNVATITGTISNLTIGQYIYITGSIDATTGENVVYRITGVNGNTIILDKNVNASVSGSQVYNVSPESALSTFTNNSVNPLVNPIQIGNGSYINQNGITLQPTNVAHSIKMLDDGIYFYPTSSQAQIPDSWIKYNGIQISDQWSLTNKTGKVTIDGQKISTTNMYLDMNAGSNTIKIDPLVGIKITNNNITKFEVNSSTGAVSINDGYISVANNISRSYVSPSQFTIQKYSSGIWSNVFNVDGNGDVVMTSAVIGGSSIDGTTTLNGSTTSSVVTNANNSVQQNTLYNKVKITTTNGIQVLDASDNERVKIGNISGSLYGIQLKDINNNIVFQQDTNGNLGIGGKIYQVGTPNNYAVLGGLYGDMILYYSNSEFFRIYNDLTGVDLKYNGSSFILSTGSITYPQGNWNFGSSTVTGLTVAFA